MAVKSVTFHRGGVHPLEREHHGKTRSQGEAIRSVPTGQVVLPLANYAGAPAKPLVKNCLLYTSLCRGGRRHYRRRAGGILLRYAYG